ncbi:MAG: signal peptide peptidase SppA [Bacteroidia bacterium]|nr:signal peptide peptidase SppA [Bacteroidia bacterium]
MKLFLKYFGVFLLGFFSSIVLLVILIANSVAKFGSEKETEPLSTNTWLTLNLPSVLNDKSESDPFGELFAGFAGQEPVGLNQITTAIENAQNNENITGILLDPGFFASGFGQAEEIRNALITFKNSGKPLVAYSENYTEQGYYIASVCNRIFLNPKGLIEFNGLSSGIVMYKGMLDKLGVEFQVFKVGKFKGAVEPFIQNQLSEENKTQIKEYITSIHNHSLSKIAESRGISIDSLKSISNNGQVFLSAHAEKFKFVDQLGYKDEVDSWIEKKYKTINHISLRKFLKNEVEYKYSENKIAILYAEGEIVSGVSSQSGGQIASDDLVKEIRKIRNNDQIKALVLRVNSPGGSSLASDIISREIELTKKKMPVIVSFGNVAASGGYYISCLADSIFAQPNSITGSIGVFALFPNTQKLYKEKFGLTYESVNTGDNSELWRPDQGISGVQGAKIQAMVDQIYDDFLSVVSKGRKMNKGAVHEIAQGRVYSGLRAQELGLIDGIGGIDRAIKSASKKANLKEYKITIYPEPKNPFEALLGDEVSEAFAKQQIKFAEDLGIHSSVIQELQAIKSMYGFQMRLPWSMDIR